MATGMHMLLIKMYGHKSEKTNGTKSLNSIHRHAPGQSI